MKAKPNQIEALSKQIQSVFKIALIHGADFSIVEDSANQIINLVLTEKNDFSLIKINASQLKNNPSLLLDEANTVSFLTPKKLIWVLDITDKDENLKTAIYNFEQYSQSSTFLLLTGNNLPKNSEIRLFAEKQSNILEIACYEDTKEQKQLYIQNKIKLTGYTIQQDALSLLINRLNENRLITNNEIEKLLTYMGQNKNITVNDIENCITDMTFSSGDLLCFAIGLGNQEKADKYYQILLSNGESPVSIARILSIYFNKLLLAINTYEKTRNMDDALKKILKTNQFNLKSNMIIQIQKIRKTFIIKVLNLLLETESQLKSSNVIPELLLERNITSITTVIKKQVQ